MAVLVNKETGEAQNLSEQEALTAAQMGTHEVPLVDPQGNQVLADYKDVPALLQKGHRQPSQQELGNILDYTKYSQTGEQLKTAVEGAAEAATFGASSEIEGALLGNKEEQLKRREINPVSHAVGQAAGLVGSALTGVGEGALLERAGALAAEKAGLGAVGSLAVRGAVENMLFQGGDEASKMFLNDPHQTISTALMDIGTSGLLGGALGGAMGGAGELWKMGPGKKLEATLDAIKNRSAGLPKELSGLELAPEVQSALGNSEYANKLGQELRESNTWSGKNFQSKMNEARQTISNATAETLNRTPEAIDELRNISNFDIGKTAQSELNKSLKEVVEPISQKYDELANKFKSAPISEVTKTDIANKVADLMATEGYAKMPDSISNKIVQKALEHLPLQETAQDLRNYARNIMESNQPRSEGYQAAKKLRDIFREGQGTTLTQHIGEKAPELMADFQKANADYAGVRRLIDDLNDRLHVGKFGGPDSFMQAVREMEPETLIRRLSPKGDVGMQQLLEQFPAVKEIVKEHELNNLLKSSLAKDGTLNPLKLFNNLDKASPEMRQFLVAPENMNKLQALRDVSEKMAQKLNPSGTAKTLDMMWENVPAAAAGMAAMVMGHSGIVGALLGKAATLIGKEAPDAVKLAMLKFLSSSQATNSQAFQSMVKMAGATIRGEAILNKAVKGVFGEARMIIPEVSMKDREKLKKQVNQLSENPEALLHMSSASGHYMPEHTAAMGELSGRIVGYLANQRPMTNAPGPLDQPTTPSKAAEAAYNRAIDIACNPAMVLKYVKEGSINLNDIQHLHAMFPELYGKMQAKLMEQMTEAKTKGSAIPYFTQLGLSAFMGQPLSYSMSPQAIMAAQPQVPQSNQPMPGARPKHSMTSLSKMPGMSQTTQQYRELRRSGGTGRR